MADRQRHTCEQCGAAFEGRASSRFCGDRCRQRAHRGLPPEQTQPQPSPSARAEKPAPQKTRAEREYAEALEESKTLSETAKAKFDRLLNKAYRALQASYESEVRKGVNARIAAELETERQRAREKFEESQRALNEYLARRDGVKRAMTRDQWRLLLNCLHPDRAPDDRKTRFAEAFAIIKRLEPYL